MLRHGWALALLLGLAGLFVLPDIPLDADVLKLAACALVAAPLACVALARRGGAPALAWLTSTGGRLFVAAVLLAALGSAVSGGAVPGDAAGVLPAAVIDRVLQVLLALLAGALGADVARRAPAALATTIIGIGTLVALVCLAQALGLENSLSPPAELTAGFKEVVGTLGNSNRAGALLALALVAALARSLFDATRPGGTHWIRTLTLLLLSAALVWTRSRGGRLAALAALLVMLWALRRTPRPDLRPSGRRLAAALAPVLAGLLLAAAVGGSDVLWAVKPPQDLAAGADIEVSADITTDVRLSLWSATIAMTRDRPLLGWGLGDFRQVFPAYRDPAEAALPGLGGAATRAWHPHNEYLLGASEGGWPAGLALLLFALLSVTRALSIWRQDRSPEDLAALAVISAGGVLALVQDAWVSPGSGLPFFAAAGFVWGSDFAAGHHHHAHPDAPQPASARAVPWVAAALVAAVSVGLAWPRWSGHFGAWRFQRDAQVQGIDGHNYTLLAAAAAAAPADEDLQRMLVYIGRQWLPAAPRAEQPDVSASLAAAVLRIEALENRRAALGAPR